MAETRSRRSCWAPGRCWRLQPAAQDLHRLRHGSRGRRQTCPFPAGAVVLATCCSSRRRWHRRRPLAAADRRRERGDRIQEASWLVAGAIHGVWDGYAALRRVHEDNARLTQENTDLRSSSSRPGPTRPGRRHARPARVAPAPGLEDHRRRRRRRQPLADYRAVTIDKGLTTHLPRHARPERRRRRRRVAQPSANTATVQLLIDRSAAAAVRIERTRTEALPSATATTRCASSTSPRPPTCRRRHGGDGRIDGVYPPGLGIGLIEHVERAGPRTGAW